MKALEPGRLVCYSPHGMYEDAHHALVLARNVGHEEVHIVTIRDRKLLQVPHSACIVADPRDIYQSFVGFIGWHRNFGHGGGVDGERIEGLPHLTLERPDGTRSVLIPVSDVVLSYRENRAA